MDAAGYYSDNLKLINEAISIICRKHGMSRDEELDFSQHVHLQLIEDDYRKIRAFKGSSSLKTYLYTVISRILIDQKRTKWHPSAEALRMGPAAVELEKLVYRNQYAVHEACQILAVNPATAIDEDRAHALLGKLHPKRPRLTIVDNSEERLPAVPDPAPDPEKQIAQKQLQLRKEKLCALAGAIAQSLSAEDKLLIKMHFVSGHKISEIGRLLGKEDRLLYTRIQAILRNLRKAMEEAGTGGGEVQEVLCAMGGSDG